MKIYFNRLVFSREVCALYYCIFPLSLFCCSGTLVICAAIVLACFAFQQHIVFITLHDIHAHFHFPYLPRRLVLPEH